MTTNTIEIYRNLDGSIHYLSNDIIVAESNVTNVYRLIAPFDNTNGITVNFELSNKILVPKRTMKLVGSVDSETDNHIPEGETWNVWEYTLSSAILGAVSSDISQQIKINESILELSTDGSGEMVNLIRSTTVQSFTINPTIHNDFEEIDVSNEALILLSLADLEGRVEDLEVLLGLNGENFIKSDIGLEYPTATELDMDKDFFVIKRTDGDNFSVTARVMQFYFGGNFLGHYAIYTDLPDIVGDVDYDDNLPYEAIVNFELDGITPLDTIHHWDTENKLWIDTGVKGEISRAEFDALVLLVNQIKDDVENAQTGDYDDLLQSIKDLIPGTASQEETIANSINALKPLIVDGAGDMLKLEYATTVTGMVDKSISDKLGNDIVNTYEIKTNATSERALKVDKQFNDFNGTANQVKNAINETWSNSDVNRQNINSNSATLGNHDGRISQNTSGILDLDASKISGMVIQDTGITIDNQVTQLNFSNNLQLTQNAPGAITIDAVNAGNILITIEQEGASLPHIITLAETKIDQSNKTISSDDTILDVDVNGDVEFLQNGTYELDGNIELRSTDISTERTVDIIFKLNGIEHNIFSHTLSEAQAGQDTVENIPIENKFSNIIAPQIMTVHIKDTLIDDIQVTVDKLDFFVTTGTSGIIPGNIMFSDVYDTNLNGQVDNADYDGTGTNYLTGTDDTQDSITELDNKLQDVDVLSFDNKNDVNQLQIDMSTKQAKLPGDLNTVATSTSGAINENTETLGTKLSQDDFHLKNIGGVGNVEENTLTGVGTDEELKSLIPVVLTKSATIQPFNVESIVDIPYTGDTNYPPFIFPFTQKDPNNSSFEYSSNGIKNVNGSTQQVKVNVTGTVTFEAINQNFPVDILVEALVNGVVIKDYSKPFETSGIHYITGELNNISIPNSEILTLRVTITSSRTQAVINFNSDIIMTATNETVADDIYVIPKEHLVSDYTTIWEGDSQVTNHVIILNVNIQVGKKYKFYGYSDTSPRPSVTFDFSFLSGNDNQRPMTVTTSVQIGSTWYLQSITVDNDGSNLQLTNARVLNIVTGLESTFSIRIKRIEEGN